MIKREIPATFIGLKEVGIAYEASQSDPRTDEAYSAAFINLLSYGVLRDRSFTKAYRYSPVFLDRSFRRFPQYRGGKQIAGMFGSDVLSSVRAIYSALRGNHVNQTLPIVDLASEAIEAERAVLRQHVEEGNPYDPRIETELPFIITPTAIALGQLSIVRSGLEITGFSDIEHTLDPGEPYHYPTRDAILQNYTLESFNTLEMRERIRANQQSA